MKVNICLVYVSATDNVFDYVEAYQSLHNNPTNKSVNHEKKAYFQYKFQSCNQ